MRIEAYVAIPVGTVPSLEEFVRGMRESMGDGGGLRKVVFDEGGVWRVVDEGEGEVGGKGRGKGKGKGWNGGK